MDLLYTGRFDGFCLISSDSDFTRLAARIRESGLTVYGFGERKTPKPFVAACDKFIYLENLTSTSALLTGTPATPLPRASAAKLKGDTVLVNLLRNALQAYSDDDRWAGVANVGHFITKQRPDFDARTYGYAKLSDLIAATTLFELDRRTPSDGKPAIVYVRDKRHQSKSPLVTPPTNQQGSTIPASEPGQNATRLTESSGYPGATQ